jgi:hypothetical protein
MKKPPTKAAKSQPPGKKSPINAIGRAVDSILLETRGAALLPIAPRLQGKGGAVRFGRPPGYFATNNAGTLLTQSGRLKLARARLPGNKGVDVRQLVDFGQTPVERELIRFIGQHKPDLLTGYQDPMKALCVLRIIYVPLLCHAFVNEMAKTETSTTMQLWLGFFAAFYKACERTVSERIWRRQRQTASPSKQRRRGIDAAKLPLRRILDYFDDPPGGHLFWINRFGHWQDSTVRSLDYYISKQSSDVRRLDGAERAAAIIGALKKLDSFPERFFGALERELKSAVDLKEIIQRNARASRYTAEPPSITKDTWLIEIWPLVAAYGWNWHDLARVYHAKFDVSALVGSARIRCAAQSVTSADTDQLKDRCRQLGLQISIEAMKPGRPKRASQESTAVLPVMGGMAMQIDGIGAASDWILGESAAVAIRR